MMKRPIKVGVVLAGCGYLDGAEIHEAVLTLLYLDQAGAEAVCLAPDVDQAGVVDHRTSQAGTGTRGVLTESARIARGRIASLDAVEAGALDALILPGGFGAAKNLCTFAFDGAGMTVNPHVEALIRAVHAAGKPIGAWCIAPALLARLIPGVRLTIGDDPGTAAALEAMGAVHVPCAVDGVVVDADLRVVTTPAYMLGPWIADVAQGIRAGVDEVLTLVRSG
jgi:enhancing lycopene biosynthesis protein 2